jgi:hypothetical protein
LDQFAKMERRSSCQTRTKRVPKNRVVVPADKKNQLKNWWQSSKQKLKVSGTFCARCFLA